MEAQQEWIETDSPSMSACFLCRHITTRARCSAYPGGIPDRLLFTDKVHRSVEPDQTGTDVFVAKDEYYAAMVG